LKLAKSAKFADLHMDKTVQEFLSAPGSQPNFPPGFLWRDPPRMEAQFMCKQRVGAGKHLSQPTIYRDEKRK
jgi:hypothetical protein